MASKIFQQKNSFFWFKYLNLKLFGTLNTRDKHKGYSGKGLMIFLMIFLISIGISINFFVMIILGSAEYHPAEYAHTYLFDAYGQVTFRKQINLLGKIRK